jgi:cation diffusion facilitator CzcD-associated flavoprotein CzcO
MTSILIVGAGPAGLACATTLTCQRVDADIEVVDPSGTWMAAWRRRFAAQDIPNLRSPAVHHPHPDPFGMLEHAAGEGLIASGGTQLPTTGLFDAFIDEMVERRGLTDRVTPTTAIGLRLRTDGRPEVRLADGSTRRPDRVVLATNARRPQVPDGLIDAAGTDAFAGTEHADVADTPAGGHVLIVGGGLSAAHLAIGAARRGARVTMLTRRRLRIRRFDTDPSWLGPRKRRPFEQEPDALVRRRTIDTARGGGSIPARVRRDLDRCIEAGVIDLRERVQVVGCDPAGQRVRVRCSDGRTILVDVVWCATGGQIDVGLDPLFRDLVTRYPTAIARGLPELEADLSWPGTSVHVSGFGAALRLGPTAGNLVGQRRAALRIAAAVRGDDPVRSDRIATGRGACPDDHGPTSAH